MSANPEAESSGPPRISAEKLCNLTGLTDRRHRQLAKSGYFPPPLRGNYEFVPTLQGMFKFYREQQSADSPIDLKKLEKLTQETALLDIELSRARNEVMDVETVFRVWENVAMAIRRTVLMSELSEIEKDGILKELQSVTKQNYVEQHEHDSGAARAAKRGVPSAGANQQKPVGGEIPTPVG